MKIKIEGIRGWNRIKNFIFNLDEVSKIKIH